MSRIRDLIYSFVYNPTVDNRFALAEEYYKEQQYAIALTFYLKTAELSDNKDLQYYCLIRCAKCFEIPKNRKHSVMTLYKHAIKLLPDRPEAYYYLSRLYENFSEWIDAYFFAELATLKKSTNDIYQNKLNYPYLYGPLFQKAISSWHIGRGEESRDLLHFLKNELFEHMDEAHKISLQQNITRLGSSEPHCIYTKNKFGSLKYKFTGAINIDQTYSQSMQELFVLSVLNGKYNGTYLEIGSADPIIGNNTYLLEKTFGWTGIGLELKKELVDKYNQQRSNKAIEQDATIANYNSLLNQIAIEGLVDYLQIDAEPAIVTYDILKKIPFNEYKFRVITYEHDYYSDITKSCRNLSRKYLQDLGYRLVVSDICADRKKRCSYEDWWVHPSLTDSLLVDKMIDNQLYKYPEEYFYA
jgi:hypothetical protein